jgi:hypothetical protein
LIFVSDQILASRIEYQAVKITQDFHPTAEWSLRFMCFSEQKKENDGTA